MLDESVAETDTGFAPPFRALLSGPAAAPSVEIFDVRSTGYARVNEAGVNLPNLPGYEMLSELGRGGMGVVYLARQLTLKRLVALKMVSDGSRFDASLRVRFRTEAEAVARLQHPNIVQIHEVGEHEGRSFLCMEHLGGGDLKQKIASDPQPVGEAACTVETLARAVQYMHERGILHRDLNPKNVLLSADGIPKISDFGLARQMDVDGLTRTDAVIGTPSYMAPEQAAGDAKKIGPAADIYSLGAILYELLTGRAPFCGTTLFTILEQVRTQEPLPPRRLCRSVPRDLETICLKCLEKEPHNRYANAAALADDLRRHLNGEPIAARPMPIWQRCWRKARRRPRLAAVVLGATMLTTLSMAGWSNFRASEELARHRRHEIEQRFLERRNDAFFYGLLAAEEGKPFLGADGDAVLRAAKAAAWEALSLAAINVESGEPFIDRDEGSVIAGDRERAGDCYTLLLLLANLETQDRECTPHSGKERGQRALRLLDLARALGLQTRAYQLRRAECLEKLGDLDGASAERGLAEAIPLQGALDHFIHGEQEYRRGDMQAAIQSFHRAITLQPDHFWTQFLLAVCHLKTGQWETAKIGLSACLARQPDFVWAYLLRSFANEKLQARSAAEADFAQALRLNPKDDARYALFQMRGILDFDQKQFDRAKADFESARDLKPNQYNAYLNLAQVHLAQGRFELADEHFKTALQLKPPVQVVVNYHVERARGLLRRDLHEDALRACDAARTLAPNLPTPHLARGHALLALGRHASAEESFNQYLRLGGPETPDLFRGRGAARMQLGRYPEAAEDYTRVLERAPDAEMYQHRGWAHFFADAWKLALRDFTQAIERDAEASDSYTGRGLAYVMLGDYQNAVRDAEDALRRHPDTPEMMHNVACIFAQAAARVDADKSVVERLMLAANYRHRALDALRRTLQMVDAPERPAFWRDKVLPDAALAPIRAESAFAQLQAEYSRGLVSGTGKK